MDVEEVGWSVDLGSFWGMLHASTSPVCRRLLYRIHRVCGAEGFLSSTLTPSKRRRKEREIERERRGRPSDHSKCPRGAHDAMKGGMQREQAATTTAPNSQDF